MSVFIIHFLSVCAKLIILRSFRSLQANKRCFVSTTVFVTFISSYYSFQPFLNSDNYCSRKKNTGKDKQKTYVQKKSCSSTL